ncbi:zinc-binding dehydrogenase [Tropicimonas marinistellae]|uniref:zinc-binding dehydrogenase n=1 Tax=Tropicimonas marinistellae TaxID=1739787 RepID=UPI000833AB22|nr:zinc-binding dehydrogenase [Tropicimonas marinistellae]
MKAVHTTKRALSLVERQKAPVRGTGQVKVRVQHASVNPTDLDIVNGGFDLYFRLYGAKSPERTGLEFSGLVVEGSARFPDGAHVFGYTHLIKGPKTHQQVISVPEGWVAAIPEGMSFAEAAAFPLAAQTSLVALRDVARLRPGQTVLIIGGSGGLGVFAIQIARNFGASVTGLAGPAGQRVMTALGAERVFDYRETPLSDIAGPFDAALDLSARYRFRDVRHLLAPRGVFVPADPVKNARSIAANPIRAQKTGKLYVDRGNSALLTELARQAATGALETGHVREFPLEEYRAAFETLKTPGRIGRTVLRMQ